MSEKAELIKYGVKSGLRNLNDIRDIYNSFAEGGDLQQNSSNIPEPVDHQTPWAITSISNYRGTNQAPTSALYFNSREDRDAYAATKDMTFVQGMLPELTVTAANNTPQRVALVRSRETRRPNTDFSHAMDMTNTQKYRANLLAGVPIFGSDPHTCLNTVTGFYDPENTVASNFNIVSNPEDYGYRKIPQSQAVPGDLIILSNREGHPNHAVMFDSVSEGYGIHNGYNYAPGDTLVNYSNGGRSTENYRLQGPLKRFDNLEKAGGDFSGPKTYLRYTGKRKKK